MRLLGACSNLFCRAGRVFARLPSGQAAVCVVYCACPGYSVVKRKEQQQEMDEFPGEIRANFGAEFRTVESKAASNGRQ